MPLTKFLHDIVQQPLLAIGAMLAGAVGAKTGWLSISFAFLGCVLGLILTLALATSVARMRSTATPRASVCIAEHLNA